MCVSCRHAWTPVYGGQWTLSGGQLLPSALRQLLFAAGLHTGFCSSSHRQALWYLFHRSKESNLECQAHMANTFTWQAISLCLHFSFWNTVSHWPWSSSLLPLYCLWAAGYRCRPPYLPCPVGAGDLNSGLNAYVAALTDRATCLAPNLFFSKKLIIWFHWLISQSTMETLCQEGKWWEAPWNP